MNIVPECPKSETGKHYWDRLDKKQRVFAPKYGVQKHYKRADQFFCVHCLEINIVLRETEADKQPDWWTKDIG